jgi:hypothetical protein
MAANPTTVTGVFTTTFVSPGLVFAKIVWTVPGGTFTQNLTITPDGVLVQTTQTGFSAGNWGLTFPILTSDGTTSPNTWGASTTTTSIPSGTVSGSAAIASATWPVSLDSINFMVISANSSVFTSETSCQTASGNVTPVRAVVSGDTTLNAFVYLASSSDPSAASVQSGFSITGTNTFSCTALGCSVTSDSTNGTIYIGSISASGWAQRFTLSGGTVTFSAPCFFIAQVSSGVVTQLEVDRAVTATVQGNAPRSLFAYTPSTFP